MVSIGGRIVRYGMELLGEAEIPRDLR